VVILQHLAGNYVKPDDFIAASLDTNQTLGQIDKDIKGIRELKLF
jgi:hypothetical protein